MAMIVITLPYLLLMIKGKVRPIGILGHLVVLFFCLFLFIAFYPNLNEHREPKILNLKVGFGKFSQTVDLERNWFQPKLSVKSVLKSGWNLTHLIIVRIFAWQPQTSHESLFEQNWRKFQLLISTMSSSLRHCWVLYAPKLTNVERTIWTIWQLGDFTI